MFSQLGSGLCQWPRPGRGWKGLWERPREPRAGSTVPRRGRSPRENSFTVVTVSSKTLTGGTPAEVLPVFLICRHRGTGGRSDLPKGSGKWVVVGAQGVQRGEKNKRRAGTASPPPTEPGTRCVMPAVWSEHFVCASPTQGLCAGVGGREGLGAAASSVDSLSSRVLASPLWQRSWELCGISAG